MFEMKGSPASQKTCNSASLKRRLVMPPAQCCSSCSPPACYVLHVPPRQQALKLKD